MDYNQEVKHASDAMTAAEALDSGQPFSVREENKRRFVRLEISAPMSMRRIKDTESGFWPDGENFEISGTILNISAGGLLVDLNQALERDDIVSMNFTIQGAEVLTNVLGRVKRVEIESDGCIAGIEFVTSAYLMDHFTAAEMELISQNHHHFSDSVSEVLNRHITREQLAREAG